MGVENFRTIHRGKDVTNLGTYLMVHDRHLEKEEVEILGIYQLIVVMLPVKVHLCFQT